MELLEVMQGLLIPIVIIACAIVGYCIKHINWLDRAANEYIPCIMVVLGIVFAIVYTQELTFVVIVAGALSGLASTGCHQLITQLIERFNKIYISKDSEG